MKFIKSKMEMKRKEAAALGRFKKSFQLLRL